MVGDEDEVVGSGQDEHSIEEGWARWRAPWLAVAALWTPSRSRLDEASLVREHHDLGSVA